MYQTAQNSRPERYNFLAADNPRLFAFALLCLAGPLWVGPNLPMVDMPQHAAQVAALSEMFAGNPTFTSVFEIELFTPYLLGYLLVWVLSLAVPIDVAIQITVSLAVLAIPILSGRLLREVGGEERWKWLAIPCSFSYALYWGFLSFIVAVPLALGFMILAIRFDRQPNVRRGLPLIAASIGLFFCHIIALGFISLISLGYIVGANYRNWRVMLAKISVFTAPLPLIALWFVLTYQAEVRTHSAPIDFGPLLLRLSMLASQPAGLDTILVSRPNEFPDPVRSLLTLCITGSVVLFPFAAHLRLSRRPERVVPFALALVTFLTAPSYVFSAGFFYDRLGVFLVPLWLLCWEPAPVRRLWVERAAMAIVAIWIAVTLGRFTAFSRETLAFDALLYNMEPGKQVAALVFDPRSDHFELPIYYHFPAWYQATKSGIVDFNFADFYSQPVRYKSSVGARLPASVSLDPLKFDWDRHGGDRYDYFIVKSDVDVSNALFKEKRGAVELVFKKKWWWLYRKSGKAERDASAKVETFDKREQ
jgi:hypothetical protein